MIHHMNSRTFGAANRVNSYSYGRLQDFLARNPTSEQILVKLRAGTPRSEVVREFSETSVKYTEISIASIISKL